MWWLWQIWGVGTTWLSFQVVPPNSSCLLHTLGVIIIFSTFYVSVTGWGVFHSRAKSFRRMIVNRICMIETYWEVLPEKEEMYHIRSSNRQKTFNFNVSSTRCKIIVDCALFTKTRQACSICKIRHNKTNSETVTLSRTKTRTHGHEKFAKMLPTITLTFPSSHKNVLLYKGKWRIYVQSISWWSCAHNTVGFDKLYSWYMAVKMT